MKFKSTPVRLEHDTILEAVFEVRFDSTMANASDVLPGILYSKLNSRYGQVDKLPILQLPQAFREQDPNLRFQATHKLQGKDGYALLVGDHVLAVSVTRPYPGWIRFKAAIVESLDELAKTGLVAKIVRASIKYVNCVPVGDNAGHLQKLAMNLTIGNHTPQDGGFVLRFEHHLSDLFSIVEIQPNAEVMVNTTKEMVKGLLLAVDVINEKPPTDLLENPLTTIDTIHQREKDVFFAALTDETINSLNPVWK